MRTVNAEVTEVAESMQVGPPSASLRNRLVALLGAACAVVALIAITLQIVHARQARTILESARADGQALLERLVELRGVPLRQFAYDYSYWTELYDFVETRDHAWAQTNLEEPIAKTGLSAVWVVDRTGGTIHAFASHAGIPTSAPVPTEAWATLTAPTFRHFFATCPAGLLEIRLAPIQPTGDTQRLSEPRGWLLVGRLWDDAAIAEFATLAGGAARTLDATAPPEPAPPSTVVRATLALPAWSGQHAWTLETSRVPGWIGPWTSRTLAFMLWTAVSLTALVAGAAVVIDRAIVNPVRALTVALAADSTEPLRRLLPRADDFGALARLVATANAQRRALAEAAARDRAAAAALLASQAETERAMQAREQLQHELHDNVIQSIYAAGLGIGRARRALPDDHPAAPAIDRATNDLNRIIRDVRSMLADGDAGGEARPVAEALGELAAGAAATLGVACHASVDTTAASALPPGTAWRLERIAREAVSNAVRHGGATRIAIRLGLRRDRVVFEVEADGASPDTASPEGHGLRNMRAQAAFCGGTLEFGPRPGGGALVRIELPADPGTLRT